jgi:phage terminase small subunit
MNKRGGRTSAAALSVAANNVEVLKTAPPSPFTMGTRQDWHWRRITGAVVPDYFMAGDLPLLEAYCKTIVQHEQVSVECEKAVLAGRYTVLSAQGSEQVNPIFRLAESLARQMSSLAVKLRLSASTRYDDKKAGRLKGKADEGGAAGGKKPWQSAA